MKLDYKAIGQRVRRYRKEKGITQQTLAELSGQEPSNVSHIERGATKPGLPTIVSIANALDVTVDQLLCDSLERSRPVFEKEIESLLSDCTDKEVRILARTLRTFKENIRSL